jgi:exopolysaccharide biosynthesis predicted pyruvyltransferase EpsI
MINTLHIQILLTLTEHPDIRKTLAFERVQIYFRTWFRSLTISTVGKRLQNVIWSLIACSKYKDRVVLLN